MFYLQSDSIKFFAIGAGLYLLLVREEDITDFSQLRHGICVDNWLGHYSPGGNSHSEYRGTGGGCRLNRARDSSSRPDC